MEELVLFDANCCLGPGATQPGAYQDTQGLLKAMDRVGISESLVTHHLAVSYENSEFNSALLEIISGSPRLHPCWVVLPDHVRHGDQSLVSEMVAAGVKVARLFPKRLGPIRSWNCHHLFEAFDNYAIPLFVDFELEHYRGHVSAIDWDGLDWALIEFSQLRLVLVRAGHALDRILLPFMERHKNLYLETSYYIGTGAMERLCSRVGAERLLFGTGMPQYAPGPAITLLTYSDLTVEEKQKIGSENLKRLLGEVNPPTHSNA